MEELSAADKAFLAPYLPPDSDPAAADDDDDRGAQQTTKNKKKTDDDLPFVTLTYAQSMDSRIALAAGARTTLSGPESKTLTHYLRLRHRAILVGATTARVDDPSLTCRYPSATAADQPRPVVVDARASWDPRASKVLRLARRGETRAPWVFAHAGSSVAAAVAQPLSGSVAGVVDASSSSSSSSSAAVTASPPTTAESSRESWRTILRTLKQHGVDSVMIEGGATVINALLALPDLVDAVIVTVAPTWLGAGGVAVAPATRHGDHGAPVNAATLADTAWRQFGSDVVLCGRLPG